MTKELNETSVKYANTPEGDGDGKRREPEETAEAEVPGQTIRKFRLSEDKNRFGPTGTKSTVI